MSDSSTNLGRSEVYDEERFKNLIYLLFEILPHMFSYCHYKAYRVNSPEALQRKQLDDSWKINPEKTCFPPRFKKYLLLTEAVRRYAYSMPMMQRNRKHSLHYLFYDSKKKTGPYSPHFAWYTYSTIVNDFLDFTHNKKNISPSTRAKYFGFGWDSYGHAFYTKNIYNKATSCFIDLNSFYMNRDIWVKELTCFGSLDDKTFSKIQKRPAILCTYLSQLRLYAKEQNLCTHKSQRQTLIFMLSSKNSVVFRRGRSPILNAYAFKKPKDMFSLLAYCTVDRKSQVHFSNTLTEALLNLLYHLTYSKQTDLFMCLELRASIPSCQDTSKMRSLRKTLQNLESLNRGSFLGHSLYATRIAGSVNLSPADLNKAGTYLASIMKLHCRYSCFNDGDEYKLLEWHEVLAFSLFMCILQLDRFSGIPVIDDC